MAAIQIFADLTNRQFVSNASGTAVKGLPAPFNQDTLYWTIQPLTINPGGSQTSNQYSVIDGSEFALTVSVFTSDGATLLATQTSFTADGLSKIGTIVLNTAAMTTAIGSLTELTTLLQMQWVGANETTTLQATMTVKRSRITAGAPVPVANETFLTTNEAMALFVKYAGNPAGASITLTDSTNTYELIIKCNDDGSNASSAAA